MEKEYLHKKVIKVPLYKGLLVLIFSNSVEKVKQVVKDYNRNSVYAHAWRFNYKGKEGNAIILNFNNDEKLTHGTIAHEAYHIANFIADSRGLIPDHINDEPIAYLITWITNEVYKFMNKNNFKIEK
jgi:hypothetical protein